MPAPRNPIPESGTGCTSCAGPITRGSRAGKCRRCYLAAAKPRPTCQDCGAILPLGSKKSKRCRPCYLVAHRLPPKPKRDRKRPLPPDFAAIAPTMTGGALLRHYRCARPVLNRWIDESGVQSKPYDNRAPKEGHGRKGCYHRMSVAQKRTYTYAGPRRAMYGAPLRHDASIEGQAADVLRRYTFVFRCGEGGRYDPKGDFWRYGNAVLTPDELLERARRKGFDPEGWRRLSTAQPIEGKRLRTFPVDRSKKRCDDTAGSGA